MSRVISIFVDYAEPIEKLVSLVEPIVSTQFGNFPGDGSDFFEARTADSIIAINRHTYENDRDLKFEDYRYEIQFRPIRDRFYEAHERKTLAQAKSIFTGMKGVLNRNMILVDDLQHKLDAHDSAAISPNR